MICDDEFYVNFNYFLVNIGRHDFIKNSSKGQ